MSSIPSPPRPGRSTAGPAGSPLVARRSPSISPVQKLQMLVPTLFGESPESWLLGSTPESRTCEWWQEPRNHPQRLRSGLPRLLEDGFREQLFDWRERTPLVRRRHMEVARARGLEEPEHGLICGQTWIFPIQGVSQDQGFQQRLVLACLPPGVLIRAGDTLSASEPGYLDRPPNAARMPSVVLDVAPFPCLILDSLVLDSLVWAALEDGEAFVGVPYQPSSAPTSGGTTRKRA